MQAVSAVQERESERETEWTTAAAARYARCLQAAASGSRCGPLSSCQLMTLPPHSMLIHVGYTDVGCYHYGVADCDCMCGQVTVRQ